VPTPSRTRHLLLAGVALALLLPPQGAESQATPGELSREIQDSRRRLEEIRAERGRLQQEMDQLRSRARNVSGELQNIERQLSTSRSVLSEVDFQLEANAERIRLTTGELITARDRLRERNAVLQRRLRDIYKRGPLHEARVLLGAGSFTDLLNRYRYLQVVGRHDRALVEEIRVLEVALVGQSEELQANMSELGRLREAKLGELAELRQVEQVHQQTLTTFRSRERQAQSRIQQLEADEARMTSLVDELDRRRREAESRAAAAGAPAPGGPSTLARGDAGTLDWPVEGELLYRFGRDQRPGGTVLRWNGVGIRAPRGTPVRAVRGGTVVMAGPFEGYGPTVVVSHGEGFYSLYLYLEELGVVEGRPVEAGQVVGTVGGSETPEGARLEFQIRVPVGGGAPQAVDPLEWLRARGSVR